MPFSDSNRVGLKYIEEVTWGTTPGGPNMKKLNFTSESLKSNINTVTSDTIRSDRNVSDITVVGGGAGGDMGFELRYGDIDEFFEGALGSDWVSTKVSTTVASAYFSGNTIESDSSALNNLLVGQFVRVANATAVNNGDYQIVSVTTSAGRTNINCIDASSGAAAGFTSEVFAATTTLRSNNLRNGTVIKSYTIEKEFEDLASALHQYTGMRVTSLNLSLSTQSILTGSFAFTGKSQVTASTTLASATTAASTNTVMNASGNIGRVWEGGQAITGVVFQSITIDLTNNPRDQARVGSSDLAGVALGRCEVTGSMTAYFENNDLLDKFTNGTATNFRFQVTDDSGNSYIITIPRIRITDGTIAAGGPNADVLQELSWGAMVDSSGLYAIQIDQLPG